MTEHDIICGIVASLASCRDDMENRIVAMCNMFAPWTSNRDGIETKNMIFAVFSPSFHVSGTWNPDEFVVKQTLLLCSQPLFIVCDSSKEKQKIHIVTI